VAVTLELIQAHNALQLARLPTCTATYIQDDVDITIRLYDHLRTNEEILRDFWRTVGTLPTSYRTHIPRPGS
jgi:hypothetical protein